MFAAAADIVRDGLRAVLDSRAADTLLTNRPHISQTVATAIGEARLCARMSVTPTAADVAHAHATPCGAFGLDAELRRAREMPLLLARDKQ